MANLIDACSKFLFKNHIVEGVMALPCERGGIYQRTETNNISISVYEPHLCFILQGSKCFYHDGASVEMREGDCIMMSNEVPVAGRIAVASSDRPYLAFILAIDPEVLRTVHSRFDADFWKAMDQGKAAPSPISVAAASDAMRDAIERYVYACLDPEDSQALEPLIYEELHYHVLRAPNGAMIRRNLLQNEQEARITRAVRVLKEQFRQSLTVEELAQNVAMSPSAFHRAFKDVTGTTPLQFKKDLQLSEAQKLLAQGGATVSQVAYSVGYESPHQFSREYARRFHEPPKNQLNRTFSPSSQSAPARM